METDRRYKVVKYFDDYPDSVIARGLSYQEAEAIKMKKDGEFHFHPYTSYEIRDDAE